MVEHVRGDRLARSILDLEFDISWCDKLDGQVGVGPFQPNLIVCQQRESGRIVSLIAMYAVPCLPQPGVPARFIVSEMIHHDEVVSAWPVADINDVTIAPPVLLVFRVMTCWAVVRNIAGA